MDTRNCWNPLDDWDPQMKDDIEAPAMASIDASQNWFLRTWKIGQSIHSGKVETPAWIGARLGAEGL